MLHGTQLPQILCVRACVRACARARARVCVCFLGTPILGRRVTKLFPLAFNFSLINSVLCYFCGLTPTHIESAYCSPHLNILEILGYNNTYVHTDR
jgi:hypothetical protein